MNCQQAKQISIVQYLSSLGLKAVRISNNNYWYKSMLRHEKDASFKVDAQQNCWYDHGSAIGGNILDLVMKIYNLESISEALKKLSEKHSSIPFSFHQQSTQLDKREVRIIKVKNLQNKALIDYLRNERSLNAEIAQRYCCEVYYQVNEKRYFAIGFKNEKDGYELRNKYFKGCVGTKSITLIKNQKNECYAFEGFLDFLSYLQLFPGKEREYDFLILNSISKINEAVKIASLYDMVKIHFDNDGAGKNACKFFQSQVSNTIDSSGYYSTFIDVNAYLKSLKI